MATNSTIEADFAVPGDRVFRWWDSGAFGMEPQPLTIVRVSQKSVTVRTRLGNDFRISASELYPLTPDVDPVPRSVLHQWGPGQQAQYDSLHHRGRSRYDLLRTHLGWTHAAAYQFALKRHGKGPGR